MMDNMLRPPSAGWLLLLLLLVPGKGQAQTVVTEESLASTTEAGLAYARAGIATAELKLAAAERERLAAEARTTDSIARANRTTPTTAPMPTAVGEPGGRGTSANPGLEVGTPGASSTTEAPATESVTPPPSPLPSTSSAAATPLPPAPAGPVTEILRARAAQGSGAVWPDGQAQTGSPEAGFTDAPPPTRATATGEQGPLAGAAMEATDQAAVPLDAPATDRQEIPSQDGLGLGSWTTGIAGAASVTATRWTTLFGDAANQHPGLMPALLLLMAGVGTTVLALGAGIRPWRRRRSADGAGQGRGMEAGEPPRPHRMRQEARVPRDVEAVLASLEVRTGRAPGAPGPREPVGSVAQAARRRA